VQIAKALGAEITGVCSTGKVDLMRSLGADHVIDYTREDFTKSGKQYDLILEANGYHPISDYRRVLTPKGPYVMTGGGGEANVRSHAHGSLGFDEVKTWVACWRSKQQRLGFCERTD